MAKTLRIESASIAILLLSCQILLAQGGTWNTVAPMPTPLGDLAAGGVGGILYAVGGEVPYPSPLWRPCCGFVGMLEAYDPGTDKWTAESPMPTPRGGVAACELGGLLYVLGGIGQHDEALPTVEVYNPKTGRWASKAPMPTARFGLAAAAVNGVLYAVGGWNPSLGFVGTVEAYNPSTNTWTPMQPMLTPRLVPAAAAVGGILFVVGGSNYSANFLATTEAYNPESNTWSTKAPMPTPRAGLAAGTIAGDLYAVGGEGEGGPPFFGLWLSTTEAYDPKTDTWRSCSPMPTARSNLAGATVGDTFYAVGGIRLLPNATGQLLAMNEAFTPFLSVTIRVNPATINLRSNVKIKVAILSTSLFDATSINPDTVKLSGALAETERNGTPIFSFDDVNDDGILDLVLSFRARNLQLTRADKQVVLKGQTFAGQLVKGVASVRIVP
ncbi:MAG TPA: kelch repeat-containing protein [Terriglobia bacterium]|nr:kelch repeat-containing protein [Terriglobia bacterium]